MADFSANDSALGYLYQARFALWELLNGPEEQELVMETLDDIVTSQAAVSPNLLQAKHHTSPAKLTDSSAELWKTLRVWSTALKDGAIKIPPTRLTLVTTGIAPEKSIASKLRPNASRNIEEISKDLIDISAKSENKQLEKAFEAFASLDSSQRKLLVSAIYVLDGSPDISDTADKIRDRLRASVDRQYRDSLFERLEGWWLGKVIEQLQSETPKPISGFEVLDKVRVIADQFKPDSLPIDFLEARPEIVDATSDDRTFVAQLRLIDVGMKRIEKAILDYYRAFEQRSLWAREELLIGDEVEKYEDSLIDEWERFASAITEDMAGEEAEKELRQAGRKIFNWAEQVADVRIRAGVTAPYVMRGSYHMLANEAPPRVWWHPKYFEQLETIITHEVISP
jgi:hypothetical protein